MQSGSGVFAGRQFEGVGRRMLSAIMRRQWGPPGVLQADLEATQGHASAAWEAAPEQAAAAKKPQQRQQPFICLTASSQSAEQAGVGQASIGCDHRGGGGRGSSSIVSGTSSWGMPSPMTARAACFTPAATAACAAACDAGGVARAKTMPAQAPSSSWRAGRPGTAPFHATSLPSHHQLPSSLSFLVSLPSGDIWLCTW